MGEDEGYQLDFDGIAWGAGWVHVKCNAALGELWSLS